MRFSLDANTLAIRSSSFLLEVEDGVVAREEGCGAETQRLDGLSGRDRVDVV